MAISLPQLHNLTSKSSGSPVVRLLEPLATRQPAIYLGLVTLFALLGYLLLLLFPLIALFILFDLPDQVRAISQWQDGLWLAVNLGVLLLAGLASVPLFRNRFAPPQGLVMDSNNAPKLWQQVEELRQEFHNPVVDSVILREGFGIDVIRTPRFGLPALYHNTLVIGLDTLLALPPEQFKSLLARRIGQLSGIHHRYLNWLATLRDIWPRYARAFKRQPGMLSRPLQWVFGIYASLYTGLTFYVARQNELEADRYALDIANDEEMARLFSQLIVTGNFLNTKFWPKVNQLAHRGKVEHLPYASLTRVLQRGLNREEMQSWIKHAFDTVSDHHHCAPLLRQRLENIGHDKPASPRPLQETAADHYIGTTVIQKITDKFDQRWLAKMKK